MNKGNQKILDTVEKTYLKTDLPNIRVGDTVRLGVEIREGEKTSLKSFKTYSFKITRIVFLKSINLFDLLSIITGKPLSHGGKSVFKFEIV